jgi:ABC-type antimicrobial peptide transport system permease subunit
MNIFTILGNYFKTSIRSMAKNKLFTLINIVGLAISMSVGLVILTFVNEVNSYDQFHSNIDNTYRVLNTYQYLDEDPSYFASTSPLAGKTIEESVTGIEDIVLIRKNIRGDFGFGDKWIPLQGHWATEGFFDVFSFKMLKGNPVTALKDPYSVVLTQSASEKLFGDEEALGQTISMDKEDEFVVTGIVADPPVKSTLDFEVLGSYITYDEKQKDSEGYLKWSNMWMFHVYFTLQETTDIENVQAAFDKISDEQNSHDEYTKINLGIQAMNDIIPGPSLSNEIGKSMDADMLWMLGALTFIVILSACFNYTNLSIARSLRRSKEVGIRKVVGARGGQVFVQFIFEAVIVSVLALLISVGLFLLIKPQFLAMEEYIQELVSLDLTGGIFIQFLLLAIFTGFLAGVIPAYLFSRLNPEGVLKGNSSIKMFGGITMRKALIVFQFTLSLMFIVAATIEYKQYKYSLNFDLGYNTENVLNIGLQGNDVQILKNELSQLPEVKSISSSLMITSIGNYWGGTMKYNDPLDSISVYYNGVDEYYLPLHDHKLLAGENFKPLVSDSLQEQIIVNEKLLERFEIPKGDYGEKAIGEVLKLDDKQAVITGVIKDFHYGRMDSDISPFCFRYYKGDDMYWLNVKIASQDMLSTMDKVESIWKKVDEIHPIQATFYDERIQDAYSELVVMVKMIGFLAFLAITIAVLGLLGMVIFTTETRLKEISIRKVLGASERKLVVLLGRGFIILLTISTMLAIPSTYILFDQVIFSEISYRANIGFVELFSGTALVFIIAILAVGSQTIQAARTNPASTLRNE